MKLVRWYNISLYLPRTGATALHLNCRYTSYTVRLFIKHSSYCANCLRDEIRRGRNLRKSRALIEGTPRLFFFVHVSVERSVRRKVECESGVFAKFGLIVISGEALVCTTMKEVIYIYIYIYAHAKAIHTCCLRMTEELGSQPKKVYACGSMRDDRLAASLLCVTSQLR